MMFNNIKDVDDYLSQERITCLICYGNYKDLSLHLVKSHDMTPDEYRSTYGIPWGRTLLCPETIEKRVRVGLAHYNKYLKPTQKGMTVDDFREAGKKMIGAERRPICPAISKMRSTLMKSVTFAGQHHTEESKRKLSESHKGNTAWNKGKTGVYSDEVLASIRRKAKERYKDPAYKKRIADLHRGLPNKYKGTTGRYTEDQLKKMKDAAKSRHKDKAVIINGVSYTKTEIAKIAGITRQGVLRRIKAGISGEALFEGRKE